MSHWSICGRPIDLVAIALNLYCSPYTAYAREVYTVCSDSSDLRL